MPSGRRRRRLALALAAVVVTGAATTLALLSAAPAGAAVVPNTWYTVVNTNSGKCVDARAAATANGTAVQQFTCNGTTAQEWQFQAPSGGFFRVNNFNNVSQVWDVTNVSTADSAPIQLWSYGGGNNQQWQPMQQSNGSFTFVSRNSGKCLDTPGASTADSVQLQQFTCNGTGAQSFNLVPVGGTGPTTTTGAPPPPGQPDFGPNVLVFDPSMSAASIQSQLTNVFNQQASNQFGSNRFAILFKPGTYNVDVNIGFYEQVIGLGLLPDNVDINGQVHVQADWNGGNATENFWRGAENMEVNPPSGTNTWAVSQADPFRRMDVRGNMQLDNNGFSSGGFIADSNVTGQINSGSQQQFLTRDSTIGSWTGSNWNMVFVGVHGAPAQSYPNPPYTTVGSAPVVQEKPFLYIDNSGNYNVFVPALRTNSSGTTWAGGNPAGTSLPISQFFIAHPGDSAATINSALSQGQNLLFTPGIYHLDSTINVNRPDTVVLGLGLATLTPDNGVVPMSVADVNGVKIGGLLFDAGQTNSPVLLQLGPSGSNADHTADPSSLDDVFFRIGGAGVGQATQTLVVNSNNVIGDDMWLWRADHGSGVGWTTNTATNGMIVNGANVTMYGLFVEHYQQYQVIWNGNGGRTYFYQSEMPYDPPDQASWMNGGTNGFASYKVANSVTSHQAFGLGIYCFFEANPSNVAAHAIESPTASGVAFHDMVTVSLGGTGTIQHIINNNGATVNSGNTVADLTSGP
ncbi:MAG TPA: RICIN domain-containing protein [Pseudonocardiaceae bacterium]|nr:RICIN domain-containing protein [Pseudonocardiaceae bacterium]